jgi:hypothetical protein
MIIAPLRGAERAMGLPHWVVFLAGFELISFFVFGLSIAMAVPETESAGVSSARSSLKKLVYQQR